MRRSRDSGPVLQPIADRSTGGREASCAGAAPLEPMRVLLTTAIVVALALAGCAGTDESADDGTTTTGGGGSEISGEVHVVEDDNSTTANSTNETVET